MNGLKTGELHKHCVEFKMELRYYVKGRNNFSKSVFQPLDINYIRNFDNSFEIGQVCLMMFAKRFL